MRDYLPPVRPFPGTPVADREERHMASRFSYSCTPALLGAMRRAGGPRQWFEEQLSPDSLPDPEAAALPKWFPVLDRTPRQHFAAAGPNYFYDITSQMAALTLMRRVVSVRQVREVMTEFWLNHFHVALRSFPTPPFRMDYDALARRHALGRVDDMMQALIPHPAMLLYLDGDLSRVRSTPGGGQDTTSVNENLGRELLELFTVGRTADGVTALYDEDDVRHSSYLLTGWEIDRQGGGAVSYVPERHYVGPVRVLDFTHDNARADGREALRAYLHHLAHHPATARRIATKLCRRFISDDPPAAVVDAVTAAYLESGTDIKAMLRTLVGHPSFAASVGAKIKTPSEDLVALVRQLGVRATGATGALNLHSQARAMGQVPADWGPPDGFPDEATSWTSAARLMVAFRTHHLMASGYYPTKGLRYRGAASWLPKRRIRFDQLVDHVCRRILSQPSTPRILGAACIMCDVTPGTMITARHGVVRYRMGRLLALVLDSPEHFRR